MQKKTVVETNNVEQTQTLLGNGVIPELRKNLSLFIGGAPLLSNPKNIKGGIKDKKLKNQVKQFRKDLIKLSSLISRYTDDGQKLPPVKK